MRRFVLVVVILAVGPACSLQKSVYWANVVNAPALSERGDKHLSLHGTLIDYQANGAYAVTDHIAVRGQADVHPGVAWSGDVGIGVFGSTRGADGNPAQKGLRWELAADVGKGATNAFTAGTAQDFDEDDNLESTTWTKVLYDTSYDRVSAQASLAFIQPHYEIIGVLRGTTISGRVEETAMRKVTGSGLEKERTATDIDWVSLDSAAIVRWDAFYDRGFVEVQLGSTTVRGPRAGTFDRLGLLYPIIAVVGVGTEF